MLKKLSELFSSISIKLFLCFWLIIAVTIICTRLVSIQFIDGQKVFPAHKTDMRKLTKLANANPPPTLQALKRLTSRPFANANKNNRSFIIAKELSTGAIYSSGEKKIKTVAEQIKKHKTNKPATLLSPQFRVTGPKLININNSQYQLFLVSKSREVHWTSYLRTIHPAVHITIALVISFIICWLLAKSLSKPIMEIQKISSQFGNGQFNNRLEIVRKDELGKLAKGFNQMADKLQQNIGAQQRLLADVSHELRTPLTRLQIAVALAKQDSVSPEKQEEYLARCEQEVTRLDQMLSDVLTLSRLENSVKKINKEKTELNQFVQAVIDDCQFLADKKQININYQTCSALIANIDNKLIASAISNILNNSIKYSPEGTNIEVLLTATKEEAMLEITDNGGGIPVHELTDIFTPFYRISQARDRGTGGTGLGLAITKQAIDLHNGEIEAVNAASGGLSIKIKLPISL